MNMLISWPMGFSICGFFGTVSRNKLISDLGEVLQSLFFWFFWDCLDEYAHFVAYRLWCFCFFWGLSREINSFPIAEKFCNLCFFWFF